MQRSAALMLPLAAMTAAGAMILAPVTAVPVAAVTFGGISSFADLEARVESANLNPGPDTIVIDAGVTIQAADSLLIAGDTVVDFNGSVVELVSLSVAAGNVNLRGGTLRADASAVSNAVAAGISVAQSARLALQQMTVNAQGSACDAGIGGASPSTDDACTAGTAAAPGPITVDSSAVVSIGGYRGAGIGGASDGSHQPIIVQGSSVVTAVGGFGAAGIGAGKDADGALVRIEGGAVDAAGGQFGSGIGGGEYGSGGIVEIVDGEVTATGSDGGGGVGGGYGGGGGSTTLSGGALTATGTSGAAGIGDGALPLDGEPEATTHVVAGSPLVAASSISGAVTIETGATLTTADSTPTQLDGTLVNDGTLTLGVGAPFTIGNGAALTNNVLIGGAGPVRGTGALHNEGVICADVEPEGLTISGDAFALQYRLPDGTLQGFPVYAANLTYDCHQLLDASTDAEVLVGWTIGVDGEFISPTTDLATAVPSGFATLEPVLRPAVLTFAARESTSRAGETVRITATAPLPLTNQPAIDVSEFVLLDGDVVRGDAPATFSTRTVGEQTITGTVGFVLGRGPVVFRGSFTHTTTPGPLAALALSPSATTVRQGDSVTLRLIGADAFGNQVDVDPADVRVTSSVPTDRVDGLTVTFPTASPHVLTVTVGEVSAQVTIEVVPALAPTGANDTGVLTGVALALIAMGAAAIGTRRRAHSRG